MNLVRTLLLPAKFRFVDRYFGPKPFRLLDIGAGNHSATKTKHWFPACEYHGVDQDRHYHNDEQDFAQMTAFYELDLTSLNFAAIPDNYFDFIMLAHVLEHLPNGDDVLAALLPKLRPGGVVYVEFPGLHSTTLPRMKGTLNFFDDDTHARIFSRAEFYNLLLRQQMRVLGGGTVRRWQALALMPIKIPHNLLRYGRVLPSVFWDLFGFAEYVVAQRK